MKATLQVLDFGAPDRQVTQQINLVYATDLELLPVAQDLVESVLKAAVEQMIKDLGLEFPVIIPLYWED